MILKELPKRIPEYAGLKEVEVIKLIMWWAHTYDSKEWVTQEDLRKCYGVIGRAVPDGGFRSYLDSQTNRRPAHVIKSRLGYKLEHRAADPLTEKYGQRDATIQLEKLLSDLPAKLASPDERSYLDETLLCLRNKAFRAAVVMAWNLAYDHLCHWILADTSRLAAFNGQQAKSYAKRNYPPITNRDSFEEMKEFEVIQVLASAGQINGATETVLKQKLDRRNKAAHPSGIVITQLNAEDMISDLIENVVLKLK